MEVAFGLESSEIVCWEAEVTENVPVPSTHGVLATAYLTYSAYHGYSQETGSIIGLHHGTVQETT